MKFIDPKPLKLFSAFLALLLLSFLPSVGATQLSQLLSEVSIKPQKGQSSQKKDQDTVQCAEVAKGQLTKLKEEQANNGDQKSRGKVARSAAGGAAVGAVGGAIFGDPGRMAASGAIRGGIRGGIRKRMVEKKEQEAKKKGAENAFLISFSTCMQERGYIVNY